MDFKLEEAESRGSVFKTLQRQYVELDSAQKKIINKLLESFNHSKESTEILNSIIEMVAVTNYHLGAQRQKEALIENMKRKVEELEFTYINRS